MEEKVAAQQSLRRLLESNGTKRSIAILEEQPRRMVHHKGIIKTAGTK